MAESNATDLRVQKTQDAIQTAIKEMICDCLLYTSGWLEMPHFLNRMFHRHSTRNRRGMLLIILVIRVKYGMLIAAVPFSI